MDRIREILVTAWNRIRDNARTCVEEFPYVLGAVYLLGVLTVFIVTWLF